MRASVNNSIMFRLTLWNNLLSQLYYRYHIIKYCFLRAFFIAQLVWSILQETTFQPFSWILNYFQSFKTSDTIGRFLLSGCSTSVYVKANNSLACGIYQPKNLTFHDGQRVCSRSGARLPEIATLQENNDVLERRVKI